jgi:hypothetical protein
MAQDHPSGKPIGYHFFRRHGARLHGVLVGLLGVSLALLFAERTMTWLTGVGAGGALVSTILLLLLIIGSDVWFFRVPDDVWKEATQDRVFLSHARTMDATKRMFAEHNTPYDERRMAMSMQVEEAVAIYRYRYTVQLLRRGARRLLLLGCLVLTLAAAARVVILIDHTAYHENRLGPGSSIISYIYFSFIAISTIGYGDITPVAVGARIVSVVFGVVTVAYVLMILNYIWMHEARRESLLNEHLNHAYLSPLNRAQEFT